MELPPEGNVITVSELAKSDRDVNAGLRLNASNGFDCTSGFSVVNSSGVKGILTAAHCYDSMTFNGTDLPFQGSAFGGPCDVQWHTAPGFNVRNLAYDGTNNRLILSSKHRDYQTLNEYVCKYGWASGYSCGNIIDKSFDPGGAMNNTLIRVHNDDGVHLSEGGDSGGPWFSVNTAYGLHVGGIGDDAYYMAINYIDYLGLSVLTNPLIFNYLPFLFFGEDQELNLTNPMQVDPYPSPSDGWINDNPAFDGVTNPYPLP